MRTTASACHRPVQGKNGEREIDARANGARPARAWHTRGPVHSQRRPITTAPAGEGGEIAAGRHRAVLGVAGAGVRPIGGGTAVAGQTAAANERCLCEMGSVSRGLQTPSIESWSDTELEYVAQWAP